MSFRPEPKAQSSNGSEGMWSGGRGGEGQGGGRWKEKKWNLSNCLEWDRELEGDRCGRFGASVFL